MLDPGGRTVANSGCNMPPYSVIHAPEPNDFKNEGLWCQPLCERRPNVRFCKQPIHIRREGAGTCCQPAASGVVAGGAASGSRGDSKRRRCRYGDQCRAGAALGLDGTVSDLSPCRWGRRYRSFPRPIRGAGGELVADLGQSDVDFRVERASRRGHYRRNGRAQEGSTSSRPIGAR